MNSLLLGLALLAAPAPAEAPAPRPAIIVAFQAVPEAVLPAIQQPLAWIARVLPMDDATLYAIIGALIGFIFLNIPGAIVGGLIGYYVGSRNDAEKADDDEDERPRKKKKKKKRKPVDEDDDDE